MTGTNPQPESRLLRSPAEAEHLAAEWSRWLGFADAVATGGGADGGVDVRATGMVAQVKAHMTPVGRPDLQRIYGVAMAESSMPLFFSLTSYTRQAIDWANAVDLPLFRFSLDGRVEPVNPAARDLQDNARNRSGSPAPFTRIDPELQKRFSTYARRWNFASALWMGGLLLLSALSHNYHFTEQCQALSTTSSCLQTHQDKLFNDLWGVWDIAGVAVLAHLAVRPQRKVFQYQGPRTSWRMYAVVRQAMFTATGMMWAGLAALFTAGFPTIYASIGLAVMWFVSLVMPRVASYPFLKMETRPHPRRATDSIESADPQLQVSTVDSLEWPT